ncbi:MAG: alkane 1-monooxygenase [Steroidobacteraceae bacterium]
MFIKVLKGWLMPLCLVFSILAFAAGGWWLWAPFVGLFALFVIGDWLLPHDLSPAIESDGLLFDLPVYAILPLLVVSNVVLFSLLGSGDVGRLGAWVQQATGFDLFTAREATTHWAQWVGGILSAGLVNAMGGTVAGHELTHRTSRKFDLVYGRWLLTFTADTSFAIEHVYGHHARVCTPDDPATARRGEGFYTFAWRSTVHSYVHAFQLEKARLAKFGKSVWNPLVSPFMRGNLQNLVPFVVAGWLGGFAGVAVWALVALVGKEMLEIQNYFAHYGLVREPGKPVQPRHSWNATHWMSTNVLYSLARHSHHHAEADARYWTLDAMPEAPTLPGGYLTMMPIALIPPLYRRVMTPALNEWDRRYATPAERELAREASLKSGMRGLDLGSPQAA